MVSPGTRDALRGGLSRVREVGRAAQLWRWEVARFSGDTFDVLYCGRGDQRWRAISLFGLEDSPVEVGPRAALAGRHRPTVLVSEASLPGSLLVPSHLSSLIPLGRPMEQIVAGFDSELRRRIRRLTERKYRLDLVIRADEIERLHHEMFVPFTLARHREHATIHPLHQLLAYSRFGRIERLLCDDQEVGAHMGYSYTRRGTRRWTTDRFGYPERIYSDARQLSDANTMNVQLACEFALETGHELYDLGAAQARPDGGLLQFKRRRKPVLERCRQSAYFHVRIPHSHRAEVLWRAPLFAFEGEALSLHVGLAASDDALLDRFREWSFGGLDAVHVWSSRQPATSLLARIEAQYREREFPTRVLGHSCSGP